MLTRLRKHRAIFWAIAAGGPILLCAGLPTLQPGATTLKIIVGVWLAAVGAALGLKWSGRCPQCGRLFYVRRSGPRQIRLMGHCVHCDFFIDD